jgi:hypothetical protein
MEISNAVDRLRGVVHKSILRVLSPYMEYSILIATQGFSRLSLSSKAMHILRSDIPLSQACRYATLDMVA